MLPHYIGKVACFTVYTTTAKLHSLKVTQKPINCSRYVKKSLDPVQTSFKSDLFQTSYRIIALKTKVDSARLTKNNSLMPLTVISRPLVSIGSSRDIIPAMMEVTLYSDIAT